MSKTKRRFRKESIGELFLGLVFLGLLVGIIHIIITVACNWGGNSEIDYENEKMTPPSISTTPKTTTTIPSQVPHVKQEVEIYKMSYQLEYTESDHDQKYSEQDVQILAGLIEAEGGIASETTRKRIGCVVLNRVVYQANSNIDQSEYSYTTLDEYGVIGTYEYHMVYGESIQDFSNVPYSVSYMY